jgi:hypothetical protein
MDGNGIPYYDPKRVHSVCEEIAGDGIVWAPISPVSRNGLINAGLPYEILSVDWLNLIFPNEWSVTRKKPVSNKPVIGRHSRAEWEKWPPTRSDVLAAYPADEEIAVRLLGVGDDLLTIVGAQYPQNWETLPFGFMEPSEFLRSIDFFVYFHHPDWVEAFGRTILEALASGAVAILPEYLRATFGNAACYTTPQDVVPTIRRLYGDWNEYRKQSNRGRRIAREKYGPGPYIKRIESLIGKPTKSDIWNGFSGARREMPTHVKQPDEEEPYDVIIASDLCSPHDSSLRLSHEVRIQAREGYRTALVHIPSGKATSKHLHNEIRACLREKLAHFLSGEKVCSSTRALIIHAPHLIDGRALESVPQLRSEKVIVVADRVPSGWYDVMKRNWLFERIFEAPIVWAPTNEDVRRGLEAEAPGLRLFADNWNPAIAARKWEERALRCSVPVVGSIGGPVQSQWPDETELDKLYPDRDDILIRLLGMPKLGGLPRKKKPYRWECFDLHTISVRKYLESLDFLFCYAEASTCEKSETAIAEAMVKGVVPVMPNRDAKDFAGGVLKASVGDAISRIRGIHANPEEFMVLSRNAARTGRRLFSEQRHLSRLMSIVGPPKSAPKFSAAPSTKRVLFFSSNGVGLGHLTRLVSVARRMPEYVEPVFATMSQAIKVPKSFGFPVEYIPFHEYLGCDIVDWNGWLKRQLAQIIDFYGVEAVVFDGSNPYSGLIEAVTPRPDIRLIWIRRGMWRAEQVNQPLIERQRFFDMIIEPGDIAEAWDKGLTAKHRGRSMAVDPIRLLDPDELLDRTTAAKSVDLDPERPAVLIQLGAGANRDIVTLTDEAVTACSKWPDLQIVLAEWLMSPISQDLWPGIRRIRGFPLSRYFNAFDFTIAAAGYNSYNEILSFGLPGIFVANENPVMDDQGARAAFAEENGAGFALKESELDNLDIAVAALMEPNIRAVTRTNSVRISRPNGAETTANLIVNSLKGQDLDEQEQDERRASFLQITATDRGAASADSVLGASPAQRNVDQRSRSAEHRGSAAAAEHTTNIGTELRTSA